MKKSLYLAVLLAFSAISAHAVTDPLSAGFKPAVDTNCAHAQYNSNVWLTDWTVKERQDTGTNPGSACTITVMGTQNEIVDFQVQYHDSGSGTAGYKVTVGNFVQTSPGSFTIGTTANDIIAYREGYINVQGQKTSTASTYYNALGVYPDYLVPPTDPYHSQATNAWPFTVSASNNQSAWVDVHIPTNALSGWYLASVTVQTGCPSSCTTISTNPVVLGVWQWPSPGFMPSTASVSVATAISGADMCYQIFGGTIFLDCGSWPGASTQDQGITLASVDGCLMNLDHRWGGCSVYPPYTNPPTQSGEISYTTAYGPLHSGTANTILPGALQVGEGYPFESGGAIVTTNLQNWATWWSGAGYPGPFGAYPCDEPPNGCSWATVVSNGTSAHASNPPTGILLTADLANVTANSALNSVDAMIVLLNQMEPEGGPNHRSDYNTWLTGNCCGSPNTKRVLGHYNDCVGTGTCANGTVGSGVTYANYDIDGLPASNREFPWTTYMQILTSDLYYTETGAWEKNGGGCCTMSTPNPYVYGNAGSGCAVSNSDSCSVYYFGGWGEGTLVYPSTSQGINYVTQPNGSQLATPIYLPSIRLKLLRDGTQDYEYLHKLDVLGYTAFANTQAGNWITNSYTFDTTGSGLNAARLALGAQLHQIGLGNIAAPPKAGVLLMAHSQDDLKKNYLATH